ncbi:MAG: hypothetical protein R2685_07760 [Candidatus Nitrosocosmicus sp.]|nr:hypothetical protein [Candidatus Nitrosocosmicus sp.]
MPKLEIIFTPDPIEIHNGTTIINLKPILVENLKNYWTFKGTKINKWISSVENNSTIAEALQERLVELYESKWDLDDATKILENSTK